MSRLLKNCPQQHSLPGVLPYDQIESVNLVDAKFASTRVTDSIWSYAVLPEWSFCALCLIQKYCAVILVKIHA